MQISRQHLEDLRYAKQLLERPSLAARLTDKVGAPIEKGFGLLPKNWSDTIHEVVNSSLHKSLEVAVKSLGKASGPPQDRFHALAAITAGATGGAFGLPVRAKTSTPLKRDWLAWRSSHWEGNQAPMTLLKPVISRSALLWQKP